MHWGRYKVSESSPQFSVYSGPPWSVGHRRKPLRPGRDPAAALLCLGSRPCGKRPQLGLPRTGATWRWGGCSAVRLFGCSVGETCPQSVCHVVPRGAHVQTCWRKHQHDGLSESQQEPVSMSSAPRHRWHDVTGCDWPPRHPNLQGLQGSETSGRSSFQVWSSQASVARHTGQAKLRCKSTRETGKDVRTE